MKTMIIAYMLIVGANMDISEKVNDKIKEGWEPYGSISCTAYHGSWGTACYQPMVKKEEVKEKACGL